MGNRRWSLVVGRWLCMLLLAVPVFAQDKPAAAAAPPPKLELSPAQTDHLRVAQLRFALAQKELEATIDGFNQACAEVKAENHWAKEVRCDIRDLSIHPPEAKSNVPPPAPPAPAAKTEQPKK